MKLVGNGSFAKFVAKQLIYSSFSFPDIDLVTSNSIILHCFVEAYNSNTSKSVKVFNGFITMNNEVLIYHKNLKH